MARRKRSESAEGKALVIVESPAKARTINRYLGDDYIVKASMGHVRDLPQHDFGVDIKQGFKPTYEIVRGRSRVVSELRKLARQAREVFLATDRDREGEAIAWHLAEVLDVPPEKIRRVVFNEITRNAIREAFEHPHAIDMDRVNAQQARRILDRIVGYELSPLLWKKIARGLSAGRVQSVAVRLIVEREREIRNFKPEESWKLFAYLAADKEVADKLRPQWHEFLAGGERSGKDIQRWLAEHGAFRVELSKLAGKSFEAKTVDDVKALLEALGYRIERIERQPWDEYKHLKLELVTVYGRLDPSAAPELRIADLTTRRTKTRPPAPFTTASLQQAAASQLRFSASRTMRIAQQLYEGIDLHGEGPVGLITYMRTDSTNLAAEAVQAVRRLIGERFGPRYVPEKPNVFGKRQERAQEAHEAIRPTDPFRTPQSVRSALSDEQYRLYELIWKRFVACQMPPAEWDSTTVTVVCQTPRGEATFTGSGRKLVFDGFMRVAGVTSEDQLLPPLQRGQVVGAIELEAKQHYTSPPPRYTEASLVRALEAEGIGRPSTYAAIIDTIQERGYVEQVDRKFRPTPLGEIVTDRLIEHFPKIMDVKFTSHMEDELDKIEEAHLDWVRVLHEFYDPFAELLAEAREKMEAVGSQPSDYDCPECGSKMVYRWSRNGRFLACSRYPKCKATLNVDSEGKPIERPAGQACEQCGRPMVLRQARNGYFLGCSGYPECRHTVPCDENGQPLRIVEEEELRRPCEACGEGTMIVKWKRGRAFLGCDRYPKCKNTANIPEGVAVKKKPAPPPEPAGVKCEKCGRAMVIRKGSRGTFIACSGFPRCRNTKPIEKLEELQKSQPADCEPENPAARRAASRNGGKVDIEALGAPPPGFAWTRTGRPVVEVMPEHEEDLRCPECGSPMQLKRGRFGPFFSCTNYPKCRFVANLRGEAKKQAEALMPAAKPIPTDIPCPECGRPMMVRQGRSGRFLGCSGYPECRHTQEVPADFVVPEPAEAKK